MPIYPIILTKLHGSKFLRLTRHFACQNVYFKRIKTDLILLKVILDQLSTHRVLDCELKIEPALRELLSYYNFITSGNIVYFNLKKYK